MLKHWAQSRITALPILGGAEAERELVRSVVDMLQGEDSDEISCADIAVAAWTSGRGGLATKVSGMQGAPLPLADALDQLLDHENRAAKQVPLLLSMREDNLALVKSIASGDPNLRMLLWLPREMLSD